MGFAEEGYGFGRVFRSLYARLGRRWDVEHLEFSPLNESARSEAPWVVHRTHRPAVHLGHLEFAELVDCRQPALVFFSTDLWQLAPYLRALDDVAEVPCTVAYCPVDRDVVANPELGDLRRLDRLVVPTQFGRDVVIAALSRIGVDPVRVDVLPHGIDRRRFFPYPARNARTGRQRAREELFPDRPDLIDGFIVLNANRNQPRKRLDLTLEGFASFAADKPPGVMLYLHAGTIDVGINLIAHADRLGVLDRYLPVVKSETHPVVSDEMLNRIYNACDVGLNTSTGEGWGLVAFEHGATRAAQVVPQHSACTELWTGFASLLPATPLAASEQRGCTGAVASAQFVADELERLYTDRAYRARQAQAAWRNAGRCELSWDAVARRFDALFSEVLGEPGY